MDNGELVRKKEENGLKQKSYSFALQIVKVCLTLQEKREFVLSKQLLRSGTSIGALVEEANQANLKRILFINFQLPTRRLMKHITGFGY